MGTLLLDRARWGKSLPGAMEGIWLAAVLLVPLTIVPENAMAFHYQLPKIVLLRALVSLLITLWLVRWLLYPPSNRSLQGASISLVWQAFRRWVADQPVRLVIIAASIFIAFKRYQMDKHIYPIPGPSFELDTFNPLNSDGYYDGGVVGMLAGNAADAYDAPQDNQEFWLEMTLKRDPTVRFLVADSDQAPLAGGDYYDGIFVFHNGVLTPIQELY